MLTFYGSNTKGPIQVRTDATTLPEHVRWIDAFDPTPDERARLADLVGTRIPTHEDLVEIESSSRLALENGSLMMSVPATIKDATGYPKATPLGFVVTRDRVVTIRFERLPSFENLSRQICERGELADCALGATMTLIEIVIDHIADLLERVGDDLDEMSRSIFNNQAAKVKSSQPKRSTRAFTALMRNVGRHGDLVSKISETLLGLSRIPPFIAAKAPDRLTPELKGRLDTVLADVRSLHEYQDHLSNKTQFLLDLLLGLANIDQNNVFRVLTVVSVIGIPPTFVASMYGMNFKNMPELEWSHGYAYGLTLIAISAIGPAVWFKIKGWW